MSFLGLYIEEMFASIGASSQDNFIQDFARRLGGRQVVEVDKVASQLRGAVKEICGESVNDINNLYNEMKQMVQTASTSLYDLQVKACYGRKGTIEDNTIRIFGCEKTQSSQGGDKKVILVKVEETIKGKICDSGGDPFGISLTAKGDLKTTKDYKEKPYFIRVEGAYNEKTSSPHIYYIAQGNNLPVNYNIIIKTIINCTVPANADSEEIKQSIMICVKEKFINNLEWKFVILEERQVNNDIHFLEKGILSNELSSSRLVRQLNMNSLEEKCSGVIGEMRGGKEGIPQ